MAVLDASTAKSDHSTLSEESKTLWIDVEDLFEYIRHNRRPSGIQRLAFELYRVLRLGAEGRVRFVRVDSMRQSFTTVSWQAISDLFSELSDDNVSTRHSASRRKTNAARAESPFRRHARQLAHRIPFEIRHRTLDAARLQISALCAMADLLVFMIRKMQGRLARIGRSNSGHIDPRSDCAAASEPFDERVRPGDILLALGAPWSYPDHAGLIEKTRTRFGIQFGFLVYDIIALRRPEWFDSGLVGRFRAWFTSVLPLADHVFTISDFTAADVTLFAKQLGIPLRGSVKVVPIGAGFEPGAAVQAVPRSDLPAPGSYVLFVSTIEARKNHQLLFRVWRRMLEEMPESSVPTLVFAGRVGWLVADLMQQLENTGFLGGRIVILSDLSDIALGALYRGCLFTVFPSYYEGWGLPVTESLAFGKPCLASNKTSIPEAGGGFAHYFDPDDLNATYRTIRETIEDRAGLSKWEADIKRNFLPTPWDSGAKAILRSLAMEAPKQQQ